MMKKAPRQIPYRGANIGPFAWGGYAPDSSPKGSMYSSIDTVPITAT